MLQLFIIRNIIVDE